MTILAAYVVPHPPLIIPSVGRGEERGIQDTIDAYKEVARRIVEHRPETIVISSPHAPLYRDAFHVTTDVLLSGSMEQFRAPETKLGVPVDSELVQSVLSCAKQEGLSIVPSTWRDRDMDHATFIPLYFVEQAYKQAQVRPDYQIVRVGLSGLSFESHRLFGHCISRAVETTGRRCVLIGSGDLSHKLRADGPYGYAPEGPVFDMRIISLFEQGTLEELFTFDEAFCDQAAECGLRSFQIMAGALEAASNTGEVLDCKQSHFGAYTSELLSYEGPFGVGYAVAVFEKFDEAGMVSKDAAQKSVALREEDPYVSLARASVETYIRTGKALQRPKDLPEEMYDQQAGVFVSLHKDGDLRGCIGTIAPTTSCVADEIIRNGIAASTQDPRFSPVEVSELDSLEISVDVLREAEPVASMDQLDPARYGVIVTKGFRRGLLLPNLEGVDSVEKQVAIAKQKAGIRVDDPHVDLERFEVVRHE